MTGLAGSLLELAQLTRDEFSAAYHRWRLESHASALEAARDRQRARVRRWTGRDREGQ